MPSKTLYRHRYSFIKITHKSTLIRFMLILGASLQTRVVYIFFYFVFFLNLQYSVPHIIFDNVTM